MNSQQRLLPALILTLGLCSWPLTGLAQQDHGSHTHGDSATTQDDAGHGGAMNHGDGQGGMMQRMQQRMNGNAQGGGAMPTTGQSALDVISGVMQSLQANPDTDWSEINIDALRQHLVDMDRLALYAEAQASDIDGGSRFRVSGSDERTVAAIKRMVPTHALQIERELGWDITTQQTGNGVELTVQSPDEADVPMIRALGFVGFMVLGEHHADHHLMMAGGQPDATAMNHGGGGQGNMMNRDSDANSGTGNHQGHNHN